MSGLQVREGGFLGVAEMLGRLDLGGGRVVECPAVLEVRLLGRSKMKTLRTIGGHLRLLTRLTFARMSGSQSLDAATSLAADTNDEGQAALDDTPLSQDRG
jgi:hypothetical protein